MSSLYLVLELAEPIWAVDEDAIAFGASEDTNDIAEGGNELNDGLCGGQKSAIADCVRLRVEDELLRFPSLLRPSFLSVSWLLCSRAINIPSHWIRALGLRISHTSPASSPLVRHTALLSNYYH